ncbi:hypothetical protein BD410DRAFT_789082 [Rickenella mellea]|uniref:Uncharacterized protein n=1 Tax=Rickenella mellea TaxID=50990 RepID=A0A4Y7Q4A8_9AGAM|nr:hypothetical protein BD410DRAFT_789082 [Rickenella mellea]
MTGSIISDREGGGANTREAAPTSSLTPGHFALPVPPYKLSEFELVMREYLKRNHLSGSHTPSSFESPPQIMSLEKVLSLPHDQLPDEIWVSIFECLPTYPSPERRDRCSSTTDEYPIQRMSRTCKRMRAIALPFMYSDVYLTTDTSVLRTLLEMWHHPELVRHVRRFDIYMRALLYPPRSNRTLRAVLRERRQLEQEFFGIASVLTKHSPLTTLNFYGALPKRLADDMLAQCRPAFVRAKNISFERDPLTSTKFDRKSWVDAQNVQNILSHCHAIEQVRLSMVHSGTFTNAHTFPHSLRTLYMHYVQLSPNTYAVWLSQLPSLKLLHISNPGWAGADFTSLIAAFGHFGPNLESLAIEESYMAMGIREKTYFTWATVTTEMVKCCSTLTELRLNGVCYRADIVRDLPEPLVSLVMDRMQFGAGRFETISYVEFLDGLIELPFLKKLIVNHNYVHEDDLEAEIILRERGVQSVALKYWYYR